MSAEFVSRELRLFSPEEYLLIEDQAKYRSEYYDGRIYAMAGASRKHNLINANLIRSLGNQLVDKPCEVTSNDTRVSIASANVYFYPDTVIACDPVLFENITLLNPVVAIEVLSPSTEIDDRGAKFEAYKKLISLKEYIIVAQDKIHCEQYIRQADNSWNCKIYYDISDTLILESVDCELPLKEIYQKIKFGASEAGE